MGILVNKQTLGMNKNLFNPSVFKNIMNGCINMDNNPDYFHNVYNYHTQSGNIPQILWFLIKITKN